MNKLPVEFKEQWLTALRSEKYEQGDGLLRSIITDIHTGEKRECFCCLGVAYDVLKPNGWQVNDIGYHVEYNTENNGDSMPLYGDYPDEVWNVLEQDFVHEEFSGDIILDILANMNDGGQSFKQISDWIEENL